MPEIGNATRTKLQKGVTIDTATSDFAKQTPKKGKFPSGLNTQTTRTVSESPSGKKLKRNTSMSGQNISPSQKNKASTAILYTLREVEEHKSYLINNNENRNLKAVDFKGYAIRKEIYDGQPKPVESRFELPNNVCPTISTKHK